MSRSIKTAAVWWCSLNTGQDIQPVWVIFMYLICLIDTIPGQFETMILNHFASVYSCFHWVFVLENFLTLPIFLIKVSQYLNIIVNEGGLNDFLGLNKGYFCLLMYCTLTFIRPVNLTLFLTLSPFVFLAFFIVICQNGWMQTHFLSFFLCSSLYLVYSPFIFRILQILQCIRKCHGRSSTEQNMQKQWA